MTRTKKRFVLGTLTGMALAMLCGFGLYQITGPIDPIMPIGTRHTTRLRLNDSFYDIVYDEGILSFGFSNQDFPINRKNRMTLERRGVIYGLIDSKNETSMFEENNDKLETILVKNGGVEAHTHTDTSTTSRELFAILNPLYAQFRDSLRIETQERIKARKKEKEEYKALKSDYEYFEGLYQKIAEVLRSRNVIRVHNNDKNYRIVTDIEGNLPKHKDKISDLKILYGEGFFENEMRISPLIYYFPGKPGQGSYVYIRFSLIDSDDEKPITMNGYTNDRLERISVNYLHLSDTNHNDFSHDLSFEYRRDDATEDAAYGRHVKKVFDIFNGVYNIIRNPISGVMRKQSKEGLEHLERVKGENLDDFQKIYN